VPSDDTPQTNLDATLDARALSRLRWRCRRGFLENDILIARFFDRYAAHLTAGQAHGLGLLMALGDNDLLDLNLARKSLAQVAPALDRPDVSEVLRMLREKPLKDHHEIS